MCVISARPAGKPESEGRIGSCRTGDRPASEGHLTGGPVPAAGDPSGQAQGAGRNRAQHLDRGLAHAGQWRVLPRSQRGLLRSEGSGSGTEQRGQVIAGGWALMFS